MFSDNQETLEALNALTSAVQNQTRPLVIWIGAGPSTWAGYPLWQDLAAQMHSIFSREESGYSKSIASQLLIDGEYPKLFEQMRLANQPRYFTILSEQFHPKSSNSVHLRLVKALRRLSTASIVTTNVDETLERNLPELVNIQHSDVERIHQLLLQRTPFVCKLHGSSSSVETMVFSERDYVSIQENKAYLDAVRSMFENATVLFLGYGLRDKYVIRCLQESSADRPLFGLGPHFIVTPDVRMDLPPSIRRIQYVAESADHRDALQVLEAIADIPPQSPTEKMGRAPTAARQSLYFIADLIPPGTWTTSQTVMIRSSTDSSEREMIVGEGYIDGEVELNNYSALHDIVVGLICFDTVCVSLENLGRLHTLLGSEAFWIFIKSGCLRLVIPPSEPVIIFPDKHASIGSLAAVTFGSKEHLGEPVKSVSQRIREQILPVNGKEDEAEELFHILESTAIDASESVSSDLITARTHSALIHPSISQVLGFSRGTPRHAIPRWMAFPIIRLAKVVRTGLICKNIGANSTRMVWGSEKLASVAFSASTGSEWADSAASYVLSGKYNSDVGEIVSQEPSLLLKILSFRESPIGENFRREVTQRLTADDGGQIVTAINAGLSQALPSSVLEQARNQLSGLFIPRHPNTELIPAVWGDLHNSDKRIAGWRKRSRKILEEEAKRQKLAAYDECPCGSGEKLKFCCLAALA